VRLTWKIFWIHKAGNSPEDYEDAYGFNAQGRSFAIADGASEASFAGIWARRLVEGFTASPFFCHGCSYQSLQRRLRPMQEAWHRAINWEELPFYAEEKAQAGAYAAFLGLQFDPSLKDSGPPIVGGWHAMAVGDCCLFQVRDNTIVESFPLQQPNAFNNSPALLSSLPQKNQRLWEESRVIFYQQGCAGRIWVNDLFILTTDALGEWFLRQSETVDHCDSKDRHPPWRILNDLSSPGQFEELVQELRRQKLLRNDDTTLIIIKVLLEESLEDT